MTKPVDEELYNEVKRDMNKIYKKSSAYRSGAYVKEYKKRFQAKYGDKEPYKNDGSKPLKRWFQESWTDIGGKGYPVYRPTVRINSNTPLLVSEIDPANLLKQIKIKQKIKGTKNLKPFIGMTSHSA